MLIASVGNKLRIGSVCRIHVHVLERGYSLWPTLLFRYLFFFFFLMQTSVPSSQSPGSWAAGHLGAHLWKVASGRTRLESLPFLAVVPE